MTNKVKIIIGIVAILLLGIVSVNIVYRKSCLIPEDEAIKEKSINTKNSIFKFLESLPVLEKIENKICVLQKVSPEEKAEIVAKKKSDQGFIPIPGSDKPLPPPKLGIQSPIEQDIVGKNMILGTNTWKGYLDGKLITVTGTAYRDNPIQGALFIWIPEDGISSSRIYLAPDSTGPLKIVSEEDDILTLESVAGTYEAYDINTDTRHYVTTKGGETYTFDIKQRIFMGSH